MPTVQHHFKVSPQAAQWSYTITLLVGAVVTPVFAHWANGSRRKAALVAAIASIAFGCLICALSGSLAAFLVGRALQGPAVALVVITIIYAAFVSSGIARSRVVTLLSVTSALGAGASFPLAMMLVQLGGLFAAYGVATLLSASVLLLVSTHMPKTAPGRAAALAKSASAALAACIAAALTAVSQLGSWGWTDPRIAILVVLACSGAAAFVRLEANNPAPLVDLALVTTRPAMAMNAVAVLLGISLYNVPVMVSRIAQAPAETGYGHDLNLTLVGIIMISATLGNAVGIRIGTGLVKRWSGSVAIAVGAACAAAAPLSLLPDNGGLPQLELAIFASGTGAGAAFGVMSAMIMEQLPRPRSGSLLSTNILCRLLGGAIGSAAAAAIFAADSSRSVSYPSGRAMDTVLLLFVSTCIAAGFASRATRLSHA